MQFRSLLLYFLFSLSLSLVIVVDTVAEGTDGVADDTPAEVMEDIERAMPEAADAAVAAVGPVDDTTVAAGEGCRRVCCTVAVDLV